VQILALNAAKPVWRPGLARTYRGSSHDFLAELGEPVRDGEGRIGQRLGSCPNSNFINRALKPTCIKIVKRYRQNQG